MKKKIVCLIVGLMFLLSNFTSSVTTKDEIYNRHYNNVSNWAYEDFVNAEANGLILGSSLLEDCSRNITRKEFTNLLVNLYMTLSKENPVPASNNTFTDTIDTSVRIAYNLGFINGIGGGKFCPDDPITREQISVVILNLANSIYSPNETFFQDDGVLTIKDKDDVSSWAVSGVDYVYENDIMKGDGVNFHPKKATTIEQAVVIINRVYMEYFATNQPSQNTMWYLPKPGTTWKWQLAGEVIPDYSVEMYDVDLVETPQKLIDDLHSKNIKVIGYFSAGSWEEYRDDADEFPKEVLGKVMNDWPDERWLDISNYEEFKHIIEKRLDLAVKKKFDGVEADNVDAYSNDTGLNLSYEDQIKYNIWLTNEAHKRGLAIGLKNDLEQVKDLVNYFDFAINEQAFYYNEFDLLLPFIENNKAVFGVEYNLNCDEFCEKAINKKFSFLKSDYELRGNTISCEEYLEKQDKYPLHNDITVTYFWIGEDANKENGFIPNHQSAWDEKWLEHYGGIDSPENRNGFFPLKFIPNENPFYFALPYNDFDQNGIRKQNINKIYWAKNYKLNEDESLCKNKWIKITKDDKTVYAQWEDVGPFGEDDINYVFGNIKPLNKINNTAGLDVSPAVKSYLKLDDIDIVNWKFVDFKNVPNGPWKEIITNSQIYYE